MSTSTLELGIDVGDLDRVLQVGAPTTVASVLQRLGRTGRRPATTRNLQFLALDDDEFLRAAGLLLLLGEGFVEPVIAPPEPRHVAAQQLLGRVLERGRVVPREVTARHAALGLVTGEDAGAIVDWLVETGHLHVEAGLLSIGTEAERAYGARHFMELLAVFTVPPQVTVLHGRVEIGTIDPLALVAGPEGERVIVLAGRAWLITYVDWERRRVFVEPTDRRGRSRWPGGTQPYSFELADAIRRVLLGAEPEGATLSRRAGERLARLRDEFAARVVTDGTAVADDAGIVAWWTFAGSRANSVLLAAIEAVARNWSTTGTSVSCRWRCAVAPRRRPSSERSRPPARGSVPTWPGCGCRCRARRCGSSSSPNCCPPTWPLPPWLRGASTGDPLRGVPARSSGRARTVGPGWCMSHVSEHSDAVTEHH